MTDRVAKFIASLSPKVREQLKRRLGTLKKSPFDTAGVKKMQGWGENAYRLRIGKIRVIYGVGQGNEIEIIDIDYRGNIY